MLRFAVLRITQVAVAARPLGRDVARCVMRVMPFGTMPVVKQVVITQRTRPVRLVFDTRVDGAGITAFDRAEAGLVPVVFVAVAVNV